MELLRGVPFGKSNVEEESVGQVLHRSGGMESISQRKDGWRMDGGEGRGEEGAGERALGVWHCATLQQHR